MANKKQYKPSQYKIPAYLYLFVAIIAICNVEFLFNEFASLIIVAIEVIILLFYLFKKNITNYLGFYAIFLALSFDFAVLSADEEAFNFKNFRVLNINLSLWFLIPLFIYACFAFFTVIKRKKPFSFFLVAFIVLQVISLLKGFANIAFLNDNNIASLKDVYFKFIQESAFYVIFPFSICVTAVALTGSNKKSTYELMKVIRLIIFGVSTQIIYSFVFSRTVLYGELPILIASNLYFLIPFFLIIPFINRKFTNIIEYIFIIVSSILAIYFNTNGKMILYLAIALFIIVICLFKRMKTIQKIIFIPVAILVISVGIAVFMNIKETNIMLDYKTDQAIQMINIFSDGWWENMSDSPKTRIVELLSIFDEFIKKPFYALTGKGIMGTIKDPLHFFYNKQNRGVFTLDEFAIGSYYAVHESFNIILLQNGILGFILFIVFTIKGLRLSKKNPLLLIGILWFFSVYGYSSCISVFGFLCLSLGCSIACNKAVLVGVRKKNGNRNKKIVYSPQFN